MAEGAAARRPRARPLGGGVGAARPAGRRRDPGGGLDVRHPGPRHRRGPADRDRAARHLRPEGGRGGAAPVQLAGGGVRTTSSPSPASTARCSTSTRAAATMVGLAPDADVTTTTIADYLTEEGIRASLEVEQPAVVAEGHWEGESTLRDLRGGPPTPVAINSFLMRHPDTGEPWLLATVQRDISDRIASQREVQALADQRQVLLGHLVQAQEDERARIAADVHDDSVQSLAAVELRLSLLQRDIDAQPARAARRPSRACAGRSRARPTGCGTCCSTSSHRRSSTTSPARCPRRRRTSSRTRCAGASRGTAVATWRSPPGSPPTASPRRRWSTSASTPRRTGS